MPIEHGLPPFEEIWQRSVIPLAGERLHYKNGSTMLVRDVSWEGIQRRSSLGRDSKIPIEPFLWAVEQLRIRGRVTRTEINDHFNGRYSSAVTIILAQVPEFELVDDPLTLIVRDEQRVSDG